jgi:hypothetical protein
MACVVYFGKRGDSVDDAVIGGVVGAFLLWGLWPFAIGMALSAIALMAPFVPFWFLGKALRRKRPSPDPAP